MTADGDGAPAELAEFLETLAAVGHDGHVAVGRGKGSDPAALSP